jgi:hypothetical protein
MSALLVVSSILGLHASYVERENQYLRTPVLPSSNAVFSLKLTYMYATTVLLLGFGQWILFN